VIHRDALKKISVAFLILDSLAAAGVSPRAASPTYPDERLVAVSSIPP
jgi:hypothetical protein